MLTTKGQISSLARVEQGNTPKVREVKPPTTSNRVLGIPGRDKDSDRNQSDILRKCQDYPNLA